MKLNVKYMVLTASLALGAIWNILCLTGCFPLKKWPVSLGIVCIVNLFIQIPLLFPSRFPKAEKPAATAEQTQKEKVQAGVMICLAIAWTVTMIACLVYPL